VFYFVVLKQIKHVKTFVLKQAHLSTHNPTLTLT